MALIVPPGGFAGFSQMTAASRQALSGRPTRTASVRRRRSKGSAKKSKARARTGTRRMKFGSPAWRKKYNLGKKKRK